MNDQSAERSDMMMRTLRLDGFIRSSLNRSVELRPLNGLRAESATRHRSWRQHRTMWRNRRGGGVRGFGMSSETVIEVVLPSAGDPVDRAVSAPPMPWIERGPFGGEIEEIAETVGSESDGRSTIDPKATRGSRPHGRWQARRTICMEEDLALDQHPGSAVPIPGNRRWAGLLRYSKRTGPLGVGPVRVPHGTVPTDILLPDASNLALVLECEHVGDHSISDLLKRFFPLFDACRYGSGADRRTSTSSATQWPQFPRPRWHVAVLGGAGLHSGRLVTPALTLGSSSSATC